MLEIFCLDPHKQVQAINHNVCHHHLHNMWSQPIWQQLQGGLVLIIAFLSSLEPPLISFLIIIRYNLHSLIGRQYCALWRSAYVELPFFLPPWLLSISRMSKKFRETSMFMFLLLYISVKHDITWAHAYVVNNSHILILKVRADHDGCKWKNKIPRERWSELQGKRKKKKRNENDRNICKFELSWRYSPATLS